MTLSDAIHATWTDPEGITTLDPPPDPEPPPPSQPQTLSSDVALALSATHHAITLWLKALRPLVNLIVLLARKALLLALHGVTWARRTFGDRALISALVGVLVVSICARTLRIMYQKLRSSRFARNMTRRFRALSSTTRRVLSITAHAAVVCAFSLGVHVAGLDKLPPFIAEMIGCRAMPAVRSIALINASQGAFFFFFFFFFFFLLSSRIALS